MPFDAHSTAAATTACVAGISSCMSTRIGAHGERERDRPGRERARQPPDALAEQDGVPILFLQRSEIVSVEDVVGLLVGGYDDLDADTAQLAGDTTTQRLASDDPRSYAANDAHDGGRTWLGQPG